MYQSTEEVPASLSTLPTEIADSIFYSLPTPALARLARVSKDLYAAVQGPLYRRPTLTSYKKLQGFIKTLNNVASWDKRGNAQSKRVVNLTLVIDPAYEEATTGKPLIAVVLARLIRIVARYNPEISIKLIIQHSSCDSQPVRSFETETFPRVTTLILGLGDQPIVRPETSGRSGPSSLDSVIPAARRRLAGGYNNNPGTRCQPNAKFWTRFFNGNCFPDLSRLELHHRGSGDGSRYGYGGYYEGAPILFTEMDTLGLAKIERLVVDTVPEFNDIVLMAGLKHAPLLTDLHIEDCHTTYAALDKLLLFALPVLQKLVLRIPHTSGYAQQVRSQMNIRNLPESNPHLCPHFRKAGKNLKHFDFAAPYICRDVFVDEYEKLKLREAGHPGTLIGEDDGSISSGELDIMLVTGTLRRIREHRETDSMGAKLVQGQSFEEDRQILEKERLLRNRRAQIEKERWTRKLHVLEGMCIDGDTFDELIALAAVEEAGVTWTLGHMHGRRGQKVINGMLTDINHADVFGDNIPESMRRRREGIVHDLNDDLMGS